MEMIDTLYNNDIGSVVLVPEAEDPPEPFKTPEALLNDRDPLHKLEERLDSEHMVSHNNWGIYFTTDEYWRVETPFQKKTDDEEILFEYDSSYESLVYLPEISEAEIEGSVMTYSATLIYEPDEVDALESAEEEGYIEEIPDIRDIIITDFKLALEIELFVQNLIGESTS